MPCLDLVFFMPFLFPLDLLAHQARQMLGHPCQNFQNPA